MSERAADDNRALTWASLLAKWTEFAQAAVSLPKDEAGDRWRSAVPSIITLQAVTHALGELDDLPDEERPAALDRAEILCREHAGKVHELWRGEELPGEVEALVRDSRIAFEMAANAGVEWRVASDRLVCGHPGDLIERLIGAGFSGDVFLPSPGVPLFKGAPCAFARGPGGAAPDDATVRALEKFLTRRAGRVTEGDRISTPRQVYRQMDFLSGKVSRDLVWPMHEEVPAGQPLLVLAVASGEAGMVPPEPPSPVSLDAVEVVESGAPGDA
jgi:hypothetical protein